MKTPLLCFALGCLLTAAALSPAGALTSIPRDLDQLVAHADAIFRGVAVSKQAAWKGEGANRHIVTRVTFRVAETYKGAAERERTLEFFGGELDGKGMAIPDMPAFSVGDDAILFEEGNEKQVCPLVGADQGHFQVTSSGDAERIFTHAGAGVVSAASIGETLPRTGAVARLAAAHSLTVADFRGEIQQRVERQKQGRLQAD